MRNNFKLKKILKLAEQKLLHLRANFNIMLHRTIFNSLPGLPIKTMTDPRLIMMESIARKVTVAADYNGQRIALAPHLLFERHGDLFVSALNLGKTWREGEDPRLGQFKLAGLGSPELLDGEFDPLPGFAPEAPRETDTVILAV